MAPRHRNGAGRPRPLDRRPGPRQASVHRGEAARHERRLFDAIESMANGFAMYDAEDRLVAFNKQFLDFNSRTEDLYVPGRTYEEILRAGLARGGDVRKPAGREEE